VNDDPASHLGITALHAAYADIASRRAWDELRTVVLPDARLTFDLGTGEPIEIVGPDALAAFGRRATAAFAFYLYQPLNTALVTSGPTNATGRFYALEIGVDRESGEWHEIYGGYDDEYRNVDGGWVFAQRAFRVLAQRGG
jgi:hypothetical protein